MSSAATADFGRDRHRRTSGGGTGILLAAILRAHPAVHDILAEQPQVLRDARPCLLTPGSSTP
jgi:hypothetical protein